MCTRSSSERHRASTAKAARLAPLFLLGIAACRTVAVPRGQEPAPPAPAESTLASVAEDTAVLTAVIRAVQSQPGRAPLVVDPRPLRPADDLLALTRTNLVSLPESALRARERALRGMAVELGDAVADGQASCPGILVVPARDLPDPHARCPKAQAYIVAVGLPRRGTARLPAGEIYDRDRMSAAEGYWAVRVIRTLVGPGGSSKAEYDYVMRKHDTSWAFVGAVGLLIIE
jgi:hypothetical protein